MAIIDERVPPASIEAEEAVLGSVLIDTEAIWDVQLLVKPDDFYMEKNRWIYQAMLNLQAADKPFDLIVLADELKRVNRLDEIGGEAYLIGLINTVPTSVNASSYAHLVRATALRRQLIHAASKIAGMAFHDDEDYDQPGSVDELIDKAEQTIFSLRDGRSDSNLKSAKQLSAEYIEHVEAMSATEGNILGIPTGFYDLDRLTGGLVGGDFIVPAGRPSMGKTALLLSLLSYVTMKEKKVACLFSLEMSGQRLIERLVSAGTRIDSQRLRRGDLVDTEWPNFYRYVGEVSETLLFIDDTPGITPLQARAKCRRLHARYGLDVVGFDYLQLMQSDRKHSTRVQELSEIGKGLKALARELDAAVIAPSQLNRGVESRQIKRPMISDLRDSGTIEEDADQIWLLYRDEYYNPDTSERPNIAEVDVAKNRNGPTAVVDLYWHGQLATFRNLQRQEISL